MSNLKWALNQPNEGETQKCISSYICIINDIECDMMNCLACQIPEKSMFISRGPIIYYIMGIERNKTGLASCT